SAEHETNSIVLVIGEPEGLTQAMQAVRSLTIFRQVAWLHPRERATWGHLVNRVSHWIPVFSADDEGFRQMALWMSSGRHERLPFIGTSGWQVGWRQEYA